MYMHRFYILHVVRPDSVRQKWNECVSYQPDYDTQYVPTHDQPTNGLNYSTLHENKNDHDTDDNNTSNRLRNKLTQKM